MDWYGMTDGAIIGEIGKRVRETRTRKKLSQAEVAKRSGISSFTVSQIETGKNTSLASLVAIMRVLHLLENVDNLIPEQMISPISLLGQRTKKRRK